MKTLLTLALALAVAPAFAADPIDGRWLTDSKDGVIEIAPCGPARCGRLVQMLRPPKGNGRDVNNPDPALRNRPLLGLPALTGFVPSGAAWKGQGYDPKAGRSYATTLQRLGPDTLKLKGCVAVFLCRSAIWTQVK